MKTNDEIINSIAGEFCPEMARQMGDAIRAALAMKDAQDKQPEHISKGTLCWVSEESNEKRKEVRVANGSGLFYTYGQVKGCCMKWKYATPIRELKEGYVAVDLSKCGKVRSYPDAHIHNKHWVKIPIRANKMRGDVYWIAIPASEVDDD
jgi:hypothetical protein